MLMTMERQACTRSARHIWTGRRRTFASGLRLGHSNEPRPMVDVAISIRAISVCVAVCDSVLRVHALSAGVEHFAVVLSDGQRARAAAVCGDGELSVSIGGLAVLGSGGEHGRLYAGVGADSDSDFAGTGAGVE